MPIPPSLRALRHRNYRLLFIGQLISLCGTWMQNTAQGWLVLRLTDSPLWLGIIAAAQAVPVLLLSLFAGTVADRLPKRQLMLATQTTMMLSALLLAGLTLGHLIQPWHVLILALVSGTASAFEMPARQSFTIELVGREDLLNAIALDSIVMNGSRIVGPALAGMVAAGIGEGPAFLVNGVSFVAALIGLRMMRLAPFVPPPAKSQHNQLAEGLAYVRTSPHVRRLLLQLTVLCAFSMAYIPLLPALARATVGADALGYGIIASTNAAGALIAALLITFAGDRLPRIGLRNVALLAYPIMLCGFTQSHSYPAALLLIAAVGWCGITTLTLTNTLLQIAVPDHVRGRVMSLYVLIMVGFGQAAGVLLGAIAQIVGSVTTTVAVWSAIGLALQVWLTLGARPAAASDPLQPSEIRTAAGEGAKP